MTSSADNAHLFKRAIVISMDKNIGTVHDCDVLVLGDTILKVEPSINITTLAHLDVEVIDAENCIISPGFIDGHHHLWQQLLRSLATDWSLGDYLAIMRRCYGSLYTPEDVYMANYVAALDLIYNGITTVVDHCHILNSPAHTDAAIQALKDAHIRGAWCYGFYENPSLPAKYSDLDITKKDFDEKAKANDARRAREKHFSPENSWESNLLTFGVAPSEAEVMPIAQLKEQIELGRSLNSTIITAHVAMGWYDAGNRIVERLQDTLGKDLLFSHGAAFTETECAMLAKSESGVIATPETDLQMGMGHPVAYRAQGHGCHVGLGIDITSNQGNDMLAQMRLLLQAERSLNNAELGSIPMKIRRKSYDALRMATLGGAEALGIAHLVGSITPGKRADLFMVRCDDINVVPVIDPIGILMFNANASNIDITMINGKIVKKQGRLIDADWEMMREDIRSRTKRLIEAGQKVLGEQDASSSLSFTDFGAK